MEKKLLNAENLQNQENEEKPFQNRYVKLSILSCCIYGAVLLTIMFLSEYAPKVSDIIVVIFGVCMAIICVICFINFCIKRKRVDFGAFFISVLPLAHGTLLISYAEAMSHF